MARKRWKSEAHKRRFMESQTGRDWLMRKIEERNSRRRDPGPAPERLTRTKFPFQAEINGRVATVWSDFIEYEEEGGG